MTLNEVIAQARERKGLTLRHLEEMTGISNALLSQIETGWVLEPSFTSIVKIGKALGLPLKRLAEAEPAKAPELSAPGLTWKRRGSGWEARWRARADIAARGFIPKSVVVWSGEEPSAKEKKVIREVCESYQRDMLQWVKHGRSSQD